jgi:hypothetical protein
MITKSASKARGPTMAQDQSVAEEKPVASDKISGLIPEIYYDLIARVTAGTPLLLMLLAPSWENLAKVANITSFITLLGLGYLAGHFLATISVVLNVIIWNPLLLPNVRKLLTLNYEFPSNSASQILDKVYLRIDWVAMKDQSGGAILKKMEAGSALTDNLFSAWIVIWSYYELGGHLGWNLDFGRTNNILIIAVVTVLLFISVIVRRVILVARQDGILRLLNYDPSLTEREIQR